MPKVILIQASQYDSKSGELCKRKRINLPGLALPLLAALTPKHWDVKIIMDHFQKLGRKL